MEYWFKPLEGGDWGFVALNRNKDARKITFDWKTEIVNDDLSKRDAALREDSLQAAQPVERDRSPAIPRRRCRPNLPGHDVLVLRLVSSTHADEIVRVAQSSTFAVSFGFTTTGFETFARPLMRTV